MEAPYIEQLEAALEKKRIYLEEKSLYKLKERFLNFQTHYESIYAILLRKSLIHEDPYMNERKITKVAPPPSDKFLEVERMDKMSQRLSDFHSQLDFLNLTYQFSLSFLTMERIRRVLSLLNYIDWLHFSEQSTDPTTAALAVMISRIKLGSDSMSTSIVFNALAQMEIATTQIIAVLQEVSLYLRERYKLAIRKAVFSRLPDLEASINTPEATLKEIKKTALKALPDEPFIPELAQEALEEDTTEQGRERREQVLKQLITVESEKKKQKAQEISYKDLLLDGIRVLIRTHDALEDALKKLGENRLILDSKKKGLGEKIGRLLKALSGQTSDRTVYEVEYIDPVSSLPRAERIDFQIFQEEVQRRIKLYSALSNRAGTTYRRLELATENQLFDFMSRNLTDLQVVRRRMESLAVYFRSEVSRAEHERLKGIQIELTAIKNHLINANKKKHEYVAYREEQEQMKKLGIDTSAAGA